MEQGNKSGKLVGLILAIVAVVVLVVLALSVGTPGAVLSMFDTLNVTTADGLLSLSSARK